MNNRKLPLIIVGVLLLCCICCFAFFGLFGYFSNGEECVYQGPLAPDSACEELEDALNGNDDSDDSDDSDADSDDSSNDSDSGDSDNGSDDDNSNADVPSDWKAYTNSDYSIYYPADWTVTTEAGGTLVLSPDGVDNFRLSVDKNNTFKDLSTASCNVFTDSFLDSYRNIFDNVSDPTHRFGQVAGNDACIIENLSVTAGAGVKINQEAYYIVNGDAENEAYTVVLSVNGNNSDNHMDEFEDVLDTLSIK